MQISAQGNRKAFLFTHNPLLITNSDFSTISQLFFSFCFFLKLLLCVCFIVGQLNSCLMSFSSMINTRQPHGPKFLSLPKIIFMQLCRMWESMRFTVDLPVMEQASLPFAKHPPIDPPIALEPKILFHLLSWFFFFSTYLVFLEFH